MKSATKAIIASAALATGIVAPLVSLRSPDGPPAFPREALVVEEPAAPVLPPEFTPAVATFAFDLPPRFHYYGLKRSFDNRKTWSVWLLLVNDTFGTMPARTNFTLALTGPMNQFVAVEPFATNQIGEVVK